MKELKDIIANNLSYLRKSKKMTQLELAEKLNYSDKSISKWEHGDTLPDIEVLQKLANLYEVSLDYIVSDESNEEKNKYYKKKIQNKQNQIIISLLGTSFVWLVATVIFVYSNIILNANYWLVFLWAIPTSSVVLFYFNKKWNKSKNIFIFLSVTIWSLLLCFYLQFLSYNMYLIFMLGIPVQVCIILWSKLK